MSDVNGLKALNDEFGDSAGDILIRRFAELPRLRQPGGGSDLDRRWFKSTYTTNCSTYNLLEP
jgi:PleD family two-component response regulator